MSSRLKGISFMQPVAGMVDELMRLDPTVVATYPSAAVLLAEEQQAGRLKLALHELWLGGETLSPAVRQHLEQVFACGVASSYGASEFLSMASECSRGHLHLNADWVILEPVDEQGQAVPIGQAGFTTLLTNLANHTQPLIRYDIGDRVAIHPYACNCGSTLPVIDVQGRCDDTLHLGRAGKQVITLPPLVLCTVLEDDAGLFDFQLVQQGPCHLVLSTAMKGEAARSQLAAGRTALENYLERQGTSAVRIDVRAGVPNERTSSGKAPRVSVAGAH
jgi:phenylacetate-coenzyme A ligase PaaK-like adenylate-forming protein